MRTRLRTITSVGVLVLVLAGCGDETAAQSPATSGSLSEIPTGTWVSTSIREEPPAKAPLVQPDRLYVQFFDDGRVMVSGGCNGVQGELRINDGRFVVADGAGTAMGCMEPDRHRMDEWISAFLATPPGYAYDGKRIQLSSLTTQVVLGPMEEVEPDLALEQTRWELTTISQGPAIADAGPDSSVSGRPAPAGAYLVFQNGKFTGSDGCNSLSGTATIAGDTIRFANLVTTDVACPNVTGADQVRMALQGTVRWEIDRRSLSLQHPSGIGLSLSGA